MKATYSIKCRDLKDGKYKAGTRSTTGQSSNPDYSLLCPLILKILTKP